MNDKIKEARERTVVVLLKQDRERSGPGIVVSFFKDGERYIFSCDNDSDGRKGLLRAFESFAENPELNFCRYDAAVLTTMTKLCWLIEKEKTMKIMVISGFTAALKEVRDQICRMLREACSLRLDRLPEVQKLLIEYGVWNPE